MLNTQLMRSETKQGKENKTMIRSLYFGLCFAIAFLGIIIAIHVDLWIGLGILILFIIKFFIMLENKEEELI